VVSSIWALICLILPSTASGSPAPSRIVVFSFSTIIFLARPKSLIVALSSFRPISSEIKVAPVSTAISSSIAFLRSPKPGALTATTFRTPRSLFTTNVASASPSISSAIISRGRPFWDTSCRIGSSSLRAVIFLSYKRIKGSSSSAIIFSALVTK